MSYLIGSISDNLSIFILQGLYEEVGQIKLVDLGDPELKVKDIVIEGGDGIDQFMVKPHGLSAFTDDKTGGI